MELGIRSAVRDNLAQIVAIHNHYGEHSPATFDTISLRTEDRLGRLEEHSRAGPHGWLVAVDDRARVVGGRRPTRSVPGPRTPRP